MNVTEDAAKRSVIAGELGWRYLTVDIITLAPGETRTITDRHREAAVVLIDGAISVRGALSLRISRDDLFASPGEVIDLAPGATIQITADVPTEIAVGSAPAIGKYGSAVVHPDTMTADIRGQGSYRRKVISTLTHPFPAESLVVYEAVVPAGQWAGWPPHRHDGKHGSPYLEEAYYFRFQEECGFGFHRNFDESRDETYCITNGSLVPVTGGNHVSTAAPAANMWILNFLAGSETDRAIPPYFDPGYANRTPPALAFNDSATEATR
jgi:5-deoxy-glucuronate isomerase